MPSNPTDRPAILHITESMGAGVSTALFDYVANTPEYQHHLRYVERAETTALPAGWQQGFATAAELPSGQFRRILAVRSTVRSLKPVALHSHSSFAGLYARLAVRDSAELRQIYTPHCYAFERLDLSATARWAYRTVERLLARNTGAVAACSPREAALATELSKVRPGRTLVGYVPNFAAVPAGRSAGSKVAVRTEVLRLAGSGRLGAQKDPRFFLAAVEALRQEGYDVQARWLGGGDPELARELVENGIQVTGWLPRAQLLAELAGSDVYLHSAAWEGFPLAVLEADALRIATVLRDIPAFEDSDLPLRISSPEGLAALWPQLRDPLLRSDIAERSRIALARNTGQSQRSALLRIYPAAAPTASAEPGPETAAARAGA